MIQQCKAGFLFVGILLLMGVAIQASEAFYTIQGTVRYAAPGDIYLFLVDEAGFKKPLTGIRTIKIEQHQLSMDKGEIDFKMEQIPEGIYGIRCYLDKNRNGRLDAGLFGPSEPWDMSWNRDRPSAWPRFEQMSFPVDGKTPRIYLVLE